MGVTVPSNPYIIEADYAQSSEQDLLQELVDESIEMMGQRIYYIPGTVINIDVILAEPTRVLYDSHHSLPAITPDTEEFRNSSTMMTKFGVSFGDSTDFYISKTHFAQLGVKSQPEVGDIIYHPMSRLVFKIKDVPFLESYRQLGKATVWKCVVGLYSADIDQFDTGLQVIDTSMNTLANSTPDNDTIESAISSGGLVVGTTNNVKPVISPRDPFDAFRR